MMSFLTAVLLGLVQGIAEFLPVSSSGHLVLLQNIFNVEEADLLFDVLLHLGDDRKKERKAQQGK